jgi:prepilin-type N-terminal cleavage/methylation domain-containing protein
VKRRPAFTLIEVMIAVMLLCFTAAVFTALFPPSLRVRSQAENVTRATLLAQQKIEQLRALSYEDLNYDALRTANVIDASPTTSPFVFTQVAGLASDLPQGSGTLTLTETATDLTRVDVTVSWSGAVATGNNISVTTLIANKADVDVSSS